MLPVGAWTVTAAAAPPSLDHPDAWALRGLELVSRECERALWGHEDHVYRAASALGHLNDRTFAEHRFLVATPGGEQDPSAVAGFAAMMLLRGDNGHLAWIDVWVRPERRRRGVGRLLLSRAEALAADDGRTTFVLATSHADEPPADAGEVLVPPTGAGRIRAEEPAARFALAAGYRLEQGERSSVLALPAPRATALRAQAEAVAGDDYRLLTWTDEAPEEVLDDLAELLTRAASDAPTAGLDFREDRWTPQRVRSVEAQARAAGRRVLTVAAVHRATGHLVAMTTVSLDDDAPEAVQQGYTIVLPAHRGHRLGLLVKSELVLRLGALAPQARRLRTWNAEENTHMLAINTALGFRPRGVHGMWQKTP